MKKLLSKILVVFSVVLLTGWTTPAKAPQVLATLPASDAMHWADSVMSTLTPRQRVAQLFVPRLDIVNNAEGFKTLNATVLKHGMGGFLLGKGTLNDYAGVINYAREHATVPPMVTLDGEWGLSMRITDAPRFPYSMGLGAISDESVLELYGAEVARQCSEVGINVNFAPVMDVNSNPANPVIGYRSFGEDPANVARLGSAYARGLERGGVMAVAKHFPGHGDTSADSHKTLPIVSHSRDVLDSVDLVPFATFIKDGGSGVMVGHLKVPALDASGAPASLSRAITTDLLQRDMGFRGLVFTDALAMKGAVSGSLNNCVAALKAGADVLLASSSPVADIDAVMKSIADGVLTQEDIDRHCRKVLMAKYQMGLPQQRPVELAGLERRVNSAEAEATNQALANASITAVRVANGLLPLTDDPDSTIAVVSIGAPAKNEFSEMCSRYAQIKTYSVEGGAPSQQTLQGVANADVTVVAMMSDAEWARKAWHAVADRAHNVVAVFFVKAYKMSGFVPLTNADALLAAYDDTPALRRAAAMALWGGIDVTGRFPVNVKGVAQLGEGVDLPKTRLGYASAAAMGLDPQLQHAVDSIAAKAIKAGAFPGCQVLVARHGNIVVDGSYGTLSSGRDAKAVDASTIYDVASMSKAIATLGGVMKAYDENLLNLDAEISSYIPELEGSDKGSLKVSELLYHESGMPATLPMYKLMIDEESYTPPLTKRARSAAYPHKIDEHVWGSAQARLRRDITSASADAAHDIPIAEGLWVGIDTYDTIMNIIHNVELRPDKRYRYSCLNFCLLMEMEQNVTGISHEVWVEEEIFRRIGAFNTGYNPLFWTDKERIAPTEHDQFLRRQILQGYVHDDVAAFSGGVQGNAGLFSNARDVAKYCQMLLNGGIYAGNRVLSDATVKLFTSTKSPTCNRTLGFDMTQGSKSFGEAGASPMTYGHTGFTGTCFWIDPEADLFMVFLSNRVYPTRNNRAFTEENPRKGVWDAIYRK